MEPPSPPPDPGETLDLRAELAGDRCWDRRTQALYEARGEPLDDCILQNREEVLALAEFIREKEIRSYLEIGVWTGRLVAALHRIFRFRLVAACDDGYARRFGFDLHLPPETRLFEGDSGSEAFRRWRDALGPVDLVLIDANHSYRAVRRDVEINRASPHRFLAFHDITGSNRHTRGVRRFWEELREGSRRELLRPHLELGLDHSIMGIGVWSQAEPL